jgi:quinohemoprotein amine dehydrogenase
MNRQSVSLSIGVCLLLFVATGMGAAQSTVETEQGIPVNDPLIISKCAGCHARDANGMMRRISYIRTTPEVWEQILKRMVRLNGLVTTPEESRQILRYLSSNNGLAPQEAKPVFWEVEHRLFRTQEEENGVPAPLQMTCSGARPRTTLSWRIPTWRSFPALSPWCFARPSNMPTPRICRSPQPN